MLTNSTPLSELTVADLRRLIREELRDTDRTVTGLDGLAQLFGVSRRQASRIKERIAPAVTQRGRTIVVDKERALQIYANLK